MPKIIEPDSAEDWLTLWQLAESAARELHKSHPFDPTLGRIDLWRYVTVDGRRMRVRIKLTVDDSLR